MKKKPIIIKCEDDLQEYINKDLRDMNIPFYHRKNGKGGARRTANAFTRKGVKMKWPDLIIFPGKDRVVFAELKFEYGKLEPAQDNFRKWAIKHGYAFYVVRTISAWNIVKTEEVMQK